MVAIASYNVRGIREYNKRHKIFKLIKERAFDIVFLQETHTVKNDEKIYKSQYGGQIFYSHGTSNSRGCAVLIRKNLTTTIHRSIKDPDGRYLILDVTIQDLRCTLCNVYAPNTDDVAYFVEVISNVEKLENGKIIIGGDFNTTLKLEDKRGKNNAPGHPKAAEWLNKYIEDRAMLDIWRKRNVGKYRFTFYKKKPHILMERIDFFLVSSTMSSLILHADIEPGFMNDHSIPTLLIKSGFDDKGPGYWKLNVKLLET